MKNGFTAGLAPVVFALASAILSPTAAFAGQGAVRMLYTVPNSSFIEKAAGDTNVVTINDTSGSIATLQAAINNARSTNAGAIIVIHLLRGATYPVSTAGLVLGSHECLVASGAILEAVDSSVSVPLIQITSGSVNVSVAGGTLLGNGANLYGIYAASVNRVNIDRVTAQNCGQDCIQLNGNGSSSFDNELTVTRCVASGSPGHSGISLWNATQAACLDNYCHNNSVGIWLGNCAYGTVANNTCVSNTVGIDFNSGNDNAIANNTCNNNGTGILTDGSSSMIVSDSMGSNTVAGINSSGSGNIYIDNLFTPGNAANFINGGSGDKIVAYQAPLSVSGQNYFYPPLINDQHTNIIVNGLGRTDLTNTSTTIDSVQSQYNAALAANPNNVIVLHLNGTFTVGATPLTLYSHTCVLLNGTIQINSGTGASAAITGANSPTDVCISGGIIDGGNLTGNNGIQVSSASMLQVDAVTLRNFGPDNPRKGGSDVVHFDHGSAPYIVTRCTINGGAARGIWLQLSGVKSLISDNEVTAVNQDGVDCDSSTSGAVVKFNYCHDLVRYGVFIEQSASHDLALGNICNNTGRDINLYNNSTTPRGDTAYNSVLCNWCLGNNGIRNGSTGTNVVQTSHNFMFNNVVINASITSETYGTQNYYSQNYLSGGSLSTAGTEAFFNSADVEGYVPIQDSNSGLAVLVQSAATTNGAPVVIGQPSGQGNDQWRLIPTDSGYYQVKNKNSGLDLNVSGASTSSGALIIQWPFGSGKNDQWMPLTTGNALYNLVNRLSGLDLDVPGASTTPGTQLDQQPASGAANQQFNLADSALASFGVLATPVSRTVTAGNGTNYTVTVTPLGGFTNEVDLNVSGLPAGASGTFSTNSIYGGSGSVTSSVSTLSSAAAGIYTLTIKGVSGTSTNTTTTLLTINSAPDFALAATPRPLFVMAGAAANDTVSVSRIGNFSDTVYLSVSGLPTDSVAGFSPDSITGAGTSTLTMTASNTTPVGTYPLTITGTNGTRTHTATLNLVVMNIALSAAPAAQTVLVRSNVSYAVTIATNNNFTGTVAFGVSGLPASVGAGFSPVSLNGAGTSTLTVTASNGAAAGNYTVTLTATNGALAASTAVGLTVSNLQASPGPLLWTRASGVDSNWFTAQNWTNGSAGGVGTPGISSDVVFTNLATLAASNSVDNILDGDTAINSMTFNHTNGYHTTQILPGRTLTISGSKGLLVGTETDLGSDAVVYATVIGAGATLAMTNANADLVVRQYTAGGASGAIAQHALLDLSGLDTFVDTGKSIGLGFFAGTGTARSAGTLYLARTNSLTLLAEAKTGSTNAAIDVGDNPQSNSSQFSFLYLGRQNTIYADGITVGGGRNTGWMGFNPAFGGSSAFIRGTNGASSRVTRWVVGDNSGANNTGSNSRGTNDFTGGVIDALVDTMILGRSESPTLNGNSTGVVMFASGMIDVNNLQMGVQASGATGTGTPSYQGQVDVNSGGTLIVNTNLQMTTVNVGSVGGMVLTAILNVNGGGVQAASITGGSGTSSININSGSLDAQGGQITSISFITVGDGVSASAQLVNAAEITSPNPLTIAANGSITGSSVITAPGLVVNGAISPGNNGPAWMTNNGPVTLGAGGRCSVTLQDALAGPVSGWSFLQISGGINVQSASANPFTVILQPGGGSAANFDSGSPSDWPIAAAAGVTNFAANKFTVDSSQFQNDLAGGYFLVRTNPASAGLLLSFTNNHPPLALAATYYRTGYTLTLPLALLGTNWSDPDGDPVALVSVNDSINGGSVSTDGIYIYYTNANFVDDTFIYKVQDVRTNPPAVYQPDDTVQTAVGVVTVLFSDFAVSAGPATQPTSAGGSVAYTVAVTPTNGFSGTVMLSVSGLPAGAGYSLDPTNVNGSGASTLSVTTSNTTPADNYLLTVTGGSGSLTHDTSVTLQVAPLSPPRITSMTRLGTNVVVSGTNGMPGGNYYVLATTNVAWPLTNWNSIATNSFDSNGDFSFTNAIVPTVRGLFFILQLP